MFLCGKLSLPCMLYYYSAVALQVGSQSAPIVEVYHSADIVGIVVYVDGVVLGADRDYTSFSVDRQGR